MGSGCSKSAVQAIPDAEQRQVSQEEGRGDKGDKCLRAAAATSSLPNSPEDAQLAAPSLGPLVTALVAQKLEHILREEIPLWDANCSAFGRLQTQEETDQDASVHKKAKIHGQFLARLDSYFQDISIQTHIETADIARLLHDEAARSDDAKLVVERLLKYTDYHAFAELMHRHYWVTVKEVRLFWDIENVGWDEMQQNGREVVKALRDFLDARNIGGFAAQMWAVAPTWRFADSPRVVDDLEDSAIRAVNCKSKPEAADHVIKGEIEKAALLYGKYEIPAHTVVFVLITSDQDFTDVLQRLQHAGYKTVLIHNAKQGSRHVDMMSLYASHAFSWKEVLPHSFANPRKAEKSDWQRLIDWGRGRVHPPVWVSGSEDASAHLWRIGLQFGRGRIPNEISLSEGETKNGAAKAALESLHRLLGEHFEVTSLEQRALHTLMSQAQAQV